MDKEDIKISITYNNEEYYKHIFMDYIIQVILKSHERSSVEEVYGKDE
ncbi:hypothetical protein [Clostridium sp. BSD9I1]|nr:hypothetical protein [Clostridium sp. BSD9I1]